MIKIIQGDVKITFSSAIIFITSLLLLLSFSLILSEKRNVSTAAARDPKLYVIVNNLATQEFNLVVIDTSNNKLIKTIPIGNEAVDMVLKPDNTRIYVANLQENNVSVINTSNNSLVETISLGDPDADDFPVDLTIDSTGEKLFTLQRGQDGNRLVSINTSTNQTVHSFPFDSTPTGISAMPKSNLVYVSMENGKVYVYNSSSNTIVKEFELSTEFQGMTFTPDGKSLYLTNDKGIVSVVDTTTNTEKSRFMISPVKGDPILNNNGNTLYAPGTYCLVSAVNLGTNSWNKVYPLSVRGMCGYIASNPKRDRIYISNIEANIITEMNPSTGIVTTVIPVNGSPTVLKVAL